MSFRDLRIGTKIYLVVGLLGLIAVGIGGIAIDVMATYNARVDEITLASKRALSGEQMNGLVLAVVMDSRGVYMSRDRTEVEKFGAPLVKNLDRMGALVSASRQLITTP